MEKMKKTIDSIEVVEELMLLGEKVFKNSDDAICVITYFIERAYIMGKQNKVKS